MHILVATTQVPFVQGGAEVHARSLVAALKAEGHTAEIVAMPFKWYPPERILDSMLACRLTDLVEANGRAIDRIIGLKFPAYLIPHPNKVLWILHQHRQAYEQWDGPLSDMVHYGNGREVRDAIRNADTKLIPEAKIVYTNSENVSRRLRQFCGLDSIPLYHPPHNPDGFRCDSATDDYFFYPSRINAAKRQHLAVLGLAKVPGDVRLVFCGESEDPHYYDMMQREIDAHGLRSRVEFLGRVTEEEKVALYAKCRAVVYTPYDEDYGYITLEAMLSSKPVITCADSGGPLEFVANGASGWIVDPNGEGIGYAMNEAQANPARSAQFGLTGREIYMQRNITWPAVVGKLLA